MMTKNKKRKKEKAAELSLEMALLTDLTALLSCYKC